MIMAEQEMRALVCRAVLANPMAQLDDAALVARLKAGTEDCSFDALGFDSLARMEFCIWMQIEAGIQMSEATLFDHPDIPALARHLAATR
jgi:hypothetical protein